MKRLLVAVPLFLAACGYSPLYAPGEGAATAHQRVQVGTVEMSYIEEPNLGQRRVAQVMSQRLRQDFPEKAAELDLLTVAVREDASALALRRTATVEREQLLLTATVTLTAPDGSELLETDITTTTAYNVETTPYSTESGKTFARLTAANNLAEEIIRRMALYYRTRDMAE